MADTRIKTLIGVCLGIVLFASQASGECAWVLWAETIELDRTRTLWSCPGSVEGELLSRSFARVDGGDHRTPFGLSASPSIVTPETFHLVKVTASA